MPRSRLSVKVLLSCQVVLSRPAATLILIIFVTSTSSSTLENLIDMLSTILMSCLQVLEFLSQVIHIRFQLRSLGL